MKEINLSKMNMDNCCKSIVLSLRSMYCVEMVPDDNQVLQFARKYLPEYEAVLKEYLGEQYKHYMFVTDMILKKRALLENKRRNIAHDKNVSEKLISDLYKEEKSISYTSLFNSGIYNLTMLFSLIDKCISDDFEILYYNATAEYLMAEELLRRKIDTLCTVHLGVASFIMEIDLSEQQFRWNKHYNIVPNMTQIMKNHLKIQSVKKLMNKIPMQGECFLTDFLLMVDLYRSKKQYVLVKVIIALFFIMKSPEYDKYMKRYAYTMVNLLSEIMFCGEVHRIYLQEGYYDFSSNNEKSSNNATTRMSIVFSASNEDIYIVRIDLPHKGQAYFHINMEEVVGEQVLATGFPMAYDDFCSMHIKCDPKTLEDLFFTINDRIWFRTEFKTILKHKVMEDELKKQLEKLFYYQTHILIAPDEDCYNSILFTEEVKTYLKRMNIPESYYLHFDKEDIPYAGEVKKIRGLFALENDCIKKLLANRGDCIVRLQEMANLIQRFLGVSNEKMKNTKISSVIEIGDLLEKIMES